MLRFSHFLNESKISATVGANDTERHIKKYFSPRQMETEYETSEDHPSVPKGSKIKVTSVEPISDRKSGKQIMHANAIVGGKQVKIPISKIKKKGGRARGEDNAKFSDEYAVQKVWDHVSANPKLATKPENIQAEIEKAKKDKSHPLHFDNQTNEGFIGGTKTAAHKESYYKELMDAAHTVHTIANHPSIKNTLKSGSKMKVMGAARGTLSPLWKKHGAADATSKSDVHIINPNTGEVLHRISLKKGSSQLMSAGSAETKATFEHAMNEYQKANRSFADSHKKKMMDKVEKATNLMKAVKGVTDKAKRKKLELEAQQHFHDIFAAHPELLHHVAHEAKTGHGKFGGVDSEGSARYIVTTDSNGAHVHDTATGKDKITFSKNDTRVAAKGDGREGAFRFDYKPVKKTKLKAPSKPKRKLKENFSFNRGRLTHFFSRSLVEEKLRVGIKHIKDLSHEEVGRMLNSKTLNGDVTEKSDGMAFAFGHDEHGFYTRTSHSEKMRQPEDYEAAARAKFGDGFDPSISQHFGRIHRALQANEALMNHLQSKSKPTMVKGEVFYRPHGRPAEGHPNHIRFVGTAYDTRKMGNLGSFIIHSRLPENQEHDLEKLKSLGDHNFNIHDDKVPGGSNIRADVGDIKNEYDKIDVEKLKSRKAGDREAKEQEQQKLDAVKSKLDARLRAHTHILDNKWGNETEGHLFHPHDDTLPRVKLISDTFKTNKANFGFTKK